MKKLILFSLHLIYLALDLMCFIAIDSVFETINFLPLEDFMNILKLTITLNNFN